MDIVKVSIMGICGMMLGFILKETRPEFAALVTMMTGFLILGLAAGKVSYLFETMNRLRESFPIDSSYLTVLDAGRSGKGYCRGNGIGSRV